MLRVSLILLTLLCSACWAQSHPARASYRVWVNSGDGSRSGGSSTGISKWMVVTNVHVVGNASRAEVLHPLSGKRWNGYVAARDAAADVALIYIPEGDVEWVDLGDDPQPNQECTLYGYGGDTVLKMGRGRYLSAGGSRGGGVPVWDAAVESISGDSGGGLFDSQGRLCSVNWGGGPGRGSASTPVRYVKELTRQWVQEFIQKDPKAHQLFGSAGGCFGGFCRPGGGSPSYGGGGGIPPKQPIGQLPEPSTPIQAPPTQPISPIQSPPTTPPPTQPPVQPQPPAINLDDLAKKIGDILAKDERLRGPKGDPGTDGKPGKDGSNATIDVDKLAEAVIARLPPIHVQQYDVYGQLIGEQRYPYPGPIRLQDRRGSQYTTSPK